MIMKIDTKIVLNSRGVSLVETVLAVSMISIVVVSLSLSLSHSSKNAMYADQQRIATNLARTYLTDLKSQPYAFVTPTDDSLFGGDTTCNCTSTNYLVLPSTTTYISGSAYKVTSCINYVSRSGGNWISSCPTASDTGYKNFVVNVSWTHQAKSYSVRQTSSMTRF
jgi:type II secretory pathway pseudopilin PulG